MDFKNSGNTSRIFLPTEEANAIATHTAQRVSRPVGRSAAGRELNPAAIRLAVIAHIRHQNTDYASLLMEGVERTTTRQQIAPDL